MGNTGRKITLTLKLKNVTQNSYPGITKPNLPGDPDYVPPVLDPDACPIDTILECPRIHATDVGADGVVFELSLPHSVLANPDFAKLEVVLKNGLTVIETRAFTVFDPNFFTYIFTGLSAATYTIDVIYKDDTNTVIHSCLALTSVVLAPTITWEGIDAYCEVTGSCTTGTYDSETNTCLSITSIPATPPSEGGGTPANAAHVTNNQWNNGGALVYAPGYALDGSGSVVSNLITPHFWVNGNFQWDTLGRNTTDSRMNAAGVWVAGETVDPVGEWIGFVRRVDVTTARTVYVGMCADNRFRFSLNGTLLVDCPGDIGGGPNFNFMHIYPITLAPGPNFIEMWALNDGSFAGFACEIYDQTLATLLAATSIGDLNIIFTTADMFGDPFDLGETVGWSCPVGYYLDTSGVGDPVCVQVVVTPAVNENTGMKAYTNRRRLINGIPDGFTEPNTLTGGLGTYIAPVSDLTTCPLP